MVRIKASKRTLHVLTGTAIVLFIGCGFMYFNRQSKLENMDRELAKAQSSLMNSHETVAKLDEAENDYRAAQAKLSVLEDGVSSKNYVPTLLRQLEELGKQNNLHVMAVRPKAPEVTPPAAAGSDKSSSGSKTPSKDIPPYDKLDVDIEVNGSYASAVHFLQALTSFPKIIAVKNVQITPLTDDKKKGGLAPLSVKFSATAFIMKEDTGEKKTEEAETSKPQPART